MSTFVSAIGITPPSYESQFSDHKTETFNYMVFTNDNKDTNIHISFSGPLSEYATASEYDFPLSAKSSKTITITLNYPS